MQTWVTTKAGMTVVYGTCIFRKAILLQEYVVAVTGRSLEKQMDAQHNCSSLNGGY
jgi:hypothetical protein